jgi:hypothetical protein
VLVAGGAEAFTAVADRQLRVYFYSTVAADCGVAEEAELLEEARRGAHPGDEKGSERGQVIGIPQREPGPRVADPLVLEDYAKPPESAAGSPCPKRIKTGRHAVQITGNGFSGR